jgi:hypothetical protein
VLRVEVKILNKSTYQKYKKLHISLINDFINTKFSIKKDSMSRFLPLTYHFSRSWVTIVLMAVILAFLYGHGLPGMTHADVGTISQENEEINPKAQKRWMKQTVRKLNRIKPDHCVKRIEPRVVDMEDLFMVSYRLENQEGCVTFPNGDWIYMIAHSSHDSKLIGDITLAIDNRGRLFMNEGHVCGGIIHFYTDSEMELNGADDFFGHFLSDCDDCRWYSLNRRLQRETLQDETASYHTEE